MEQKYGEEGKEGTEKTMTKEEALKLTRDVQKREKKLAQLKEKLKATLKAKDGLDVDIWLEGMAETIHQSQVISGQALQALEKPIEQVFFLLTFVLIVSFQFCFFLFLKK